MTTERDDPFLDLGYTSAEDAAALRSARLAKTTDIVVRKTTKKRRYYGPPPVGEEERLLNVNTEATALSTREITEANQLWAKREQEIYEELLLQWREAVARGEGERASHLFVELNKRDIRQQQLGRPAIQPPLPGLELMQKT